MKALGRKPPLPSFTLLPKMRHYRQTILEAAIEMDNAFDWDIADLRAMSKKLKVSIGYRTTKEAGI